MTTLLDEGAAPDTDKLLMRRFIWHATWPLVLYCVTPALILAQTFIAPWANPASRAAALAAFATCVGVVLVTAIQARHRLAALRADGVGLTEAMIAARPARHFVSPLDPISTFDVCADRLSSIGMAEALGYPRPAAFRHNPFAGRITVGRLRPFWLEGAVDVRVEQHGSGLTRVHVRRLPGLGRIALVPGAGLALVDKVCAELERALHVRRASMDAAVRAQALERSVLQAKLHALQAQVEPHFLYNTLANLKYLIRTDADGAQAMIDHLVGYLQAALPDMRAAASTVGRELDMARHYLSLMRIRMGGRLRFGIDAAPDLLDCAVPPAMLISLVENAVKHGIEPAARPGTIVVACRRQVSDTGRWLELSVRDDGAGLGAAEATGGGVGLANIHERLQLLYGRAASLRIEPGDAAGVVATLRLPLEEAA